MQVVLSLLYMEAAHCCFRLDLMRLKVRGSRGLRVEKDQSVPEECGAGSLCRWDHTP